MIAGRVFNYKIVLNVSIPILIKLKTGCRCDRTDNGRFTASRWQAGFLT